MSGQPVRTSLCREAKILDFDTETGTFTATTKGGIHPQLTRYQHWHHLWETKYKCQHLLEVDRRTWIAKTTSTGSKIWKDTNTRAKDKCKPYSRRQGDSGKRTKCSVFRYLHQLSLIVYNLEVNALTPGKTRRRRILKMQISSMLNKKCSLNKYPCQPTTHSKMRALTPLASHKKWDVIGSLSCQMQCAQS